MTPQELDQYLRKHTIIEDYLCQRPGYQMSAKSLDIYRNYHAKFTDNAEQINLSIIKQLLENPTAISDIVFPESQNIIFLTSDRFCKGTMHRHSFIEMIYVYSGCCQMVVNDNSVTLDTGDVCILDTHVSHSIGRMEENDIIVNCLMQTSYFTATFFSRLAENDLLSSFFSNALYEKKAANRYLLFRNSTDSQVPALFEKLLCEYYEKKPCYLEVVNSYMVILFAEFLRGYGKIIAPDSDKIPDDFHISDVIRFIQENCDSVSLAETARHFGYNPVYLSKMVKRFSNQTFLSLRNESRLLKARLLLEKTSMKIDSIAREVGYENIHFFYEIFKKKFGLTPAEYRKLIK